MIIWKEDKEQYSSGFKGFKNRIKCFWVGYNVIYKKDNKKPYIINCYLPSINLRFTRFETIEEAKKECERTLKSFIKELTKE